MGKRNGRRKTRKQLSKLMEMERKMKAQMAEIERGSTTPTIPPASQESAPGSSNTSSSFRLGGTVTIQKSSDGGVNISKSPSLDTPFGTVGKDMEKSINSIANAAVSLKKELEITVEMKVRGGRTTQHSSVNKSGKKHLEDILHGVGELIEGSVSQLRKGSVVMQKLSKQEESVTQTGQTTNGNVVSEKLPKQEVSLDEIIKGVVLANMPKEERSATQCTAAAPESSPKKEQSRHYEKREDIEASPDPVPSKPASLQDDASDGSSCSVNPVSAREVVYVPCRRCRLSQCSNCLSAFKEGDKIIKEIPTMKKTKTGASAPLRIETALFRIFNRTSPYRKWIKQKEMIQRSLKRTDDRLVKIFEENEEFIFRAFKVIDRYLTSSWSHCKIKDITGRALELIKNIKIADGNDETEFKMILQLLTMYRLDELDNQLKNTSLGLGRIGKREDSELDWEPRDDVVLFEPSQGFQLCAGCGQLLTVLHNAWEGWNLKMYSDEEYFNVVMVGFDRAAEARRVIFEPKADSNMKAIRGCSGHPKQCNSRYNSSGEKFPLGRLENDAMKKAVGSLHSYMGESYRRIINEFGTLSKDELELAESQSPDWVTSDEETSSSETESDGAIKA